MAQGMALYRAESFAEAEEVLAAEKSKKGRLGGTTSFFRAMSMFQQGKEQPARELFAAAKENMKPIPEDGEDPLKGVHRDQIIVWIAYREADALINE